MLDPVQGEDGERRTRTWSRWIIHYDIMNSKVEIADQAVAKFCREQAVDGTIPLAIV
jgi:hypothetical protein